MSAISGISNGSREPIRPFQRSALNGESSIGVPIGLDATIQSALMGPEASSLSKDIAGSQDSTLSPAEGEPQELKNAFNDFVGQTFFGQLIASLRSTQGENAYFNGGQAEKIFQGQFDQQLAEYMSEASADQIADPMFKLFSMRQR